MSLLEGLTTCKTMLAACDNCKLHSCRGHLCKNFVCAVAALHAYEKTGLYPEDVQALVAERVTLKSVLG